MPTAWTASASALGDSSFSNTGSQVAHSAGVSLLGLALLTASPTTTTFFKPIQVPVATISKPRPIPQATPTHHSVIASPKPAVPVGTTVKVTVKR